MTIKIIIIIIIKNNTVVCQCLFLKCLVRFDLVPKAMPHTSHVWGLASVWVLFLCTASASLRLNDFKQIGHKYGFVPVCTLLCSFRWSWRRNDLVHTSQGNRAKPEWINTCLFSPAFPLKVRPQVSQLYGRVGECTTNRCLWREAFWVNVSSHNSQCHLTPVWTAKCMSNAAQQGNAFLHPLIPQMIMLNRSGWRRKVIYSNRLCLSISMWLLEAADDLTS